MNENKQHNIKVWSTQMCHWCHKVKEYLKSKNIKFQDIDVGKDRKAAQEMVQKSGQMGVPVIEIDGQIIIGFDQEAINKALKIK
ncbi:MAG: glutaredoxin domain-containing protein [archaeon]